MFPARKPYVPGPLYGSTGKIDAPATLTLRSSVDDDCRIASYLPNRILPIHCTPLNDLHHRRLTYRVICSSLRHLLVRIRSAAIIISLPPAPAATIIGGSNDLGNPPLPLQPVTHPPSQWCPLPLSPFRYDTGPSRAHSLGRH